MKNTTVTLVVVFCLINSLIWISDAYQDKKSISKNQIKKIYELGYVKGQLNELITTTRKQSDSLWKKDSVRFENNLK